MRRSPEWRLEAHPCGTLSLSAPRCLRTFERCKYSRRCHRMLAKPRAGRVEERIGNRGAGGRDYFLTHTGRRLVLPLDDDGHNLRRLAVTQNGIADPVNARHVRA